VPASGLTYFNFYNVILCKHNISYIYKKGLPLLSSSSKSMVAFVTIPSITLLIVNWQPENSIFPFKCSFPSVHYCFIVVYIILPFKYHISVYFTFDLIWYILP
jgi:predicted neutral ceramidase superfamily lipid hydrolase